MRLFQRANIQYAVMDSQLLNHVRLRGIRLLVSGKTLKSSFPWRLIIGILATNIPFLCLLLKHLLLTAVRYRMPNQVTRLIWFSNLLCRSFVFQSFLKQRKRKHTQKEAVEFLVFVRFIFFFLSLAEVKCQVPSFPHSFR